MLGTYLISLNPERSQALKAVTLQTGRLLLLRILDEYPSMAVLHRLLNAAEPEVVLVDLEDPSDALAAAERIRGRCSKSVILGLRTSAVPLPAEHANILHAVVRFPVTSEELLTTIETCLLRLRAKVEQNLLAFMPGKAGSGSSTLAWNIAARLAEHAKVLLVEADLRSGALSWLVKAVPDGTLQQLLNKPEETDSFLLRHQFTRVGKVDALFSDRTEVHPAPAWESYFRLIDSVTRRFTYVILDLPEHVDAAQKEVLRRAGRIYLVASPDPVAIGLTERAIVELCGLGIDDERISVLLNSCREGDLGERHIAEFLDVKVPASFPADSAALRPKDATKEPLPLDTRLGRAVATFAAGLAGQPAPEFKDASLGRKLRSLLQTR